MKMLALAVILVPLVSSTTFYPCEYVGCYLFHDEPIVNGKNNIMDALKRNGFNVMSDLLDKSGLAANLSTEGPFTVFAMTDDGFAELKSKAPMWYNTFTTDLVRANLVLSDHIVNELVSHSTIRPGGTVTTLEGPVYFDSVDNGARMGVNGSRILWELEVNNGIIYAVTNLIVEDIFNMLPYMPMTIGQDVSIMMKALESTGVSSMINRPFTGPFTMLVPTDKAVKAVPLGQLLSLLRDTNKLKQLVLNHLLPGVYFVNDQKVPLRGTLQTLGGASIPFEKTADGQMTVGKNKAKLIFPNRPGNNGVNHIIDKVIMFD